MTREDIIRMARESGMVVYEGDQDRVLFDGSIVECLTRFAKLVRDDYSNKHANVWLERCHAFMLAEREACAKVCEETGWNQGKMYAKNIRARGNNDQPV